MKEPAKERMAAVMLRRFGQPVLLATLAGALVLAALAAAGRGPITVAGWSAAVVATGSMNSAIPQGSLIVTAPIGEADLAVGDDITYLSSPTTSITHRIVEVGPSAQVPGHRAFITQGVDNAQPDNAPVEAQNILGKVVFHSYPLGAAVMFVKQNWPLLIAFALIAWGLSKAMHRILGAPAGAPASVQIDELKELRPPDRAPEGGEEAHRYYMKERGQRAFG